MNYLQFSKIDGCLKAIFHNAPVPDILQEDSLRVENNLYAFVAQPSLSVIHRRQELWKGWMSLEWTFPRNSQWSLLEEVIYFCQVFSPDPAELNLFTRCNIRQVLFVHVQPLILQRGCWWPCGGSGRLFSQVVPEGKRRERRCREAPWSLSSVVASWKGPVSMTSDSKVLYFTSGRQCCSWWEFHFN